MDWNKAQYDAIYSRGKNILVSAAAGSGKTTVLVERIKQMILNDKVPVDRFLVVTFTEAAAAEMKAKILKALKDSGEGASGEELRYIRRQTELVSKANISTFHSFALEIIRKYFYVIGLEPEMKVADEANATILKRQAADNIFRKGYEKGDPAFLDFILAYGTDRKDDNAREIVLAMYDKLMSIPEPFDWLEEKTAEFTKSFEEFKDSIYLDEIYENTAKAVDRLIETEKTIADILSINGVDSLAEKQYLKYEEIRDADVYSMTFDELSGFINGCEFVRMTPKKDEKEYLEPIKELISTVREKGRADFKKVKEDFFSMTLEEYYSDICAVSEKAVTLRGLVMDFHDEYMRLKRERSLLDFNDIEHLAIRILKEEPKVCEEYRNRFEHILVDEYQDTNEVQETLISYISRGNNLFMVGDVKQSIYGFRLAEPDIFLEKYNTYAEDENSMRIDLNVNYRSKQGVIDAVNRIFMSRMTGYDDNSRLNKGIDYSGDCEYDAELVVIGTDTASDDETDDELANLKKTEIEAMGAAELIRETVGKPIYDVGAGRERPVDYRDIVVIMRSVKNKTDIYSKVFRDYDIPVYVDSNDGYFDTYEISMMENMLRTIDNPRQDIPLIALLYSPVFGFNVNELVEIRLNAGKCEYSRAFEKYIEDGPDTELRDKCRAADDKLSEWRHLAGSMELGDLIWMLMWDTGFYTYAGALAGGMQRQANLRVLSEKAKELGGMGINDLKGFLAHIDVVKEKKVNIGQIKTTPEGGNTVRIMTVHKSKGLEFPVVIAASAGDSFNYRKSVHDLSFDKDIGYGLTRIEKKKHFKRKTLIEKIIDRRSLKRQEEEEKRVMYVQYTRAADKLYILGCVNEYDIPELDLARKNESPGKNALEYIDYYLGKPRMMSLADISRAKKAREDKEADIISLLNDPPPAGGEVRKRLEYTYPYREHIYEKYKLSVTDMYHESDNSITVRTPSFASGEREYTAAELGTLTHSALEHISFDCTDAGEAIDDLVRRNIFTRSEADQINILGINTFLQDDLAKRASASPELKREKAFTMMTEKNGREVMVQGVIDCYFLEGDGYVLIDFKNTDIRQYEQLVDTYKGQLDLYEEALMRSTGRKVKERYLYLLKEGKALKI